MKSRIAKLLRFQEPKIEPRGLLFGSGGTVPSAADGWQPSAIFQDTTNGVVYVNEGTVASSSFAAIEAGVFANALTIGAFSSLTAGSGIAISSSQTYAGIFYSDDNGASIASSVSGVRSRFLLTFDQSGGSIRAIQGQLKLANLIDVTLGIYTASQGYIELAGTHITKTGATFSCFDASVEIGTLLTIDSGGEFCGLHVETTGSGTITNNGTCAGILIDKASGAASWPAGILIDGPSVIRGLRVGKFAGSAVTTSAVLFSTAQDDYSDGQVSTVEAHGGSNTNLGSGYSAKVGRFRHIVNVTTCAQETYGLMGQCVVKDTTLTHLHAGLIGTFEGHTSGVVCNGAYLYSTSAIMARVGGGGAITATKDICGFIAFWNGAAPASGSSTAFAAGDQGTAGWTNVLAVERATNLLALPALSTAPCSGQTSSDYTFTKTVKLAITIGGATYYLIADTTA